MKCWSRLSYVGSTVEQATIDLLITFSQVFPLGLLGSYANALPAGLLEERQSSCAPLIHFHAAGTSENGLGIVGNALQRDLPKAVPGAVVRAINYDTRAE